MSDQQKTVVIVKVAKALGAWKYARSRFCYRVMVLDASVLSARLARARGEKARQQILRGWSSVRATPGKTVVCESRDVCGDYAGGAYGYAEAQKEAEQRAKEAALKIGECGKNPGGLCAQF